MEEINYFDLQTLLDNCSIGLIDMHEPIEVSNKMKNKRIEITLLKHFLILCKSQKVSLIHILSRLRYLLKVNIMKLITQHPLIKQYIQNILKEWMLDIEPEQLVQDGLSETDYREGDDLFDYSIFLNDKFNTMKGGEKLTTLEKSLQERYKTHEKMTRKHADLIQEKISEVNSECTSCMDDLKNHSEQSYSRYKLVDPTYKDVLLDLSTKSKSVYLEYLHQIQSSSSEVLDSFLSDIQNLSVPDTVHTMFLNYLITINMIKKELYYVNNSTKFLMSQLKPKLDLIKPFKDGENKLELLISDENDPDDTREKNESLSNSLFGFSFF